MHPRVSQILNRLSRFPRHHTIATLLAIIATPILTFLALQLIEWWQIAGTLEPKDQIQAKNEALRTAAQVLGGTFFLITAYFTWRSVTTAEKNLLTSQEEQITDRFTKAIEQLGNEKLEIRLGGIYALERIAKDSTKDHWTIMEVLTAYIRENAPQKQENNTEKKPPSTDIQAILTVLRRRTKTPEREGDNILDLRQTNLEGANLEGANLEGADLQGANLDKANLSWAKLTGAKLIGADLQGAILHGADLQDAVLTAADLQGANLPGAKLTGAKLIGADLQGATLREANLQDAVLTGAKLTGAILFRANLNKAKLTGAVLTGADLQGATLEKAYYDYNTKWPEKFTPPDNLIPVEEDLPF